MKHFGGKELRLRFKKEEALYLMGVTVVQSSTD